MNKKFAIGIPTINCADLLVPALEKYYKAFPNTAFVIIDNGSQKIPGINEHTTIFRLEKNLGVATSWNMIAKYIFYNLEIPNAFILNDDIYWDKTDQEVIDFIDGNGCHDFISSVGEWCNFLLPEDTFKIVGEFDEQFMCYFEDNDFAYRMKLLDLAVTESQFLYPAIFRRSMSSQKAPFLKQYFQVSREHYKRKWGGYPGQEIFRSPFGLVE